VASKTVESDLFNCRLVHLFVCQDPCRFKSEKTGRGPLEEGWKVSILFVNWLLVNLMLNVLLYAFLFSWSVSYS